MGQEAVGTAGERPDFRSAFSSFSTNDIAAAKRFYGDTLGLQAEERPEGLELELAGQRVFIYPKADHEPAEFTVFNLTVDDIAAAVQQLKTLGIKFESYGGEIETDENGIFWGSRSNNGPNIAWFKDPAGNIVSVVEDRAASTSGCR